MRHSFWWTRTTVPSGEEEICTRSQNWLASHSPAPSPGAGGSRPASGEGRWPWSDPSHRSEPFSVQTRSSPCPPPYRRLLVAISLTAATSEVAGCCRSEEHTSELQSL